MSQARKIAANPEVLDDVMAEATDERDTHGDGCALSAYP